MLGYGSYVWDERCPSRRCILPPLYGKFNTTKVPQNTPRTTRRTEPEESTLKIIPFPALSKCFGKLNVQNEVSVKSNPKNCPNNGLCSRKPQKSYLGATNRGVTLKKQYFNLMWEPKIARGPTLVQFEERQREKWSRQVELHRNSLRKKRIRKALIDNPKHEEFLNSRSNPTRQIIYPAVKVDKVPLTKASFDLYLTEQCKVVKKADASVITDDLPAKQPPRGRKPFTDSIPVEVQTDSVGCATEDWIVSTMTAKIPQQAVLELQEEAELEAVRGEQRKYELSLLYRKWQEMKEQQWNDYIRAWNEIRMREILDQNSHLQDQQKRISVIGFSKNVISCCMNQTFERMKQDGYINEYGIPYVDLEERQQLRRAFESERGNNLQGRNHLARNIVDSTLINAVVQRFSPHVNEEFGRPYGAWFRKRHPNAEQRYECELESYMKSNWGLRRDYPLEVSAEFKEMKQLLSQPGHFDMQSLWNSVADDDPREGTKSDMKKLLDDWHHDVKSEEFKNFIKKDLLGRRTVESSKAARSVENLNEDGLTDERKGNDLDPQMSMLYLRKTRWSQLEKQEEHRLQEEKKAHSISTGSRPLNAASVVKATDGKLLKEIRSTDIEEAPSESGDEDSYGEALSEEMEEVDNDKYDMADSESGNRFPEENNRGSDGSNAEGD